MKKFLSLVLALVMVMSLVTVSAGAKEFTDDDKITYDEAIAVISEIGVMDGDNGAFRPTDNLTRQAAAKIICNMILGPTTAVELHADTAPFPDVPADYHFAGYIAYCAKLGIISGYGDGTFRPSAPLTGYAFMKMLLGALGYSAEVEGYGGPNWSINVAKQALGIGLNAGLESDFNGVRAVTREEAALYAFNTLQADLVEYGQKLTTNVNGTEVTLSTGGAQSRTWKSQQTRINNIVDDEIIQFAEEYFRKLEKKADTDKFERPAYIWIYDKEEIGTYVDWEKMVAEYTKGVSGRDLYDLLTNSTIKDNELAYFVDGHLIKDTTHPNGETDDIVKNDLSRSNQSDVGITDNGVLTQVFLDKDKELITIVSINTYLAKVTSEYTESREYARMDVYKAATPRNYDVDIENVPAVEKAEEDDWYLVNISYKDNSRTGDVVEITEPETMDESVITKFTKKGSLVASKVTTGGTEYKANRNAFYDMDNDVLVDYDNTLLTDNTYNIFMDQYGNFIGIELNEGVKNYVFITGFDRPQSNLSIKTADAAAIFLDGTMKEIKVNVTATDDNIEDVNPVSGGTTSAHDDGENYFIPWGIITQKNGTSNGLYALNRWYTYSESKDGVYTLKPAVRMTATRYTSVGSEEVIKTANLYVDDNVMSDNTKKPYEDVTHDNTFATALDTFGYKYLSDSERAYGNDNSVYITVDVDEVDTTVGATKAITSVNGSYTGVQDVEIEIDTSADVISGTSKQEAQVYTVYDKNHYIIGAVVVGEGNGGNATVAYVLSEAKSERYEDGIYYWEFDAVVDGKIETLTAKGDYSKMFQTLLKKESDASHEDIQEGNMGTDLTGKDAGLYDGIVELRFDADKKYVTDVRNIAEEDIYNFYGDRKASPTPVKGGNSVDNAGTYTTMALKDAKAYRINGINGSMLNGANTWIFGGTTHHYDSAPNELKLAGRTLYVRANQIDEGLALSDSATAVTVQKENGDWETREHSSVDAALSHLADPVSNTSALEYNGEIVALMKDGVATCVIFTNYTELRTGNRPNYDSNRLTRIDAGNYTLDDGTAGGYDPVNRVVNYDLVGTNDREVYTVVLEALNGGTWVESDRWTVRGNDGVTTDSAFVGDLFHGERWRLRCGDKVGNIYIAP